jgi:RNA polymerase sigma-70 factor, ECF subfamily
MDRPHGPPPDLPARDLPDTIDPTGAGRGDPNCESASVPGLEEAGARWSALVDRIHAGDESAMEELYSTFARGIRYYLCRHLGMQELDDKVHDTFLIVVQAIRKGILREPERLMGFVRTVVRRQVAAFIDQSIHNRRDLADLEVGSRIPDVGRNPEAQLMENERNQFMLQILRGISARDREILTRFYLYEQPQEQICEEMRLTETQFRLLKSRAKARFGELGRKKMARAPMSAVFLRKASGASH